MNKKIFLFAVCFLLIIGFVYYFLLKNSQKNVAPQGGSGPSFPVEGYFPLGTKDENRVIYEKIKSALRTAKPEKTPGVYLVAEDPPAMAPSSVSDYSITYFEDRTTFLIVIHARPLAETRIRAEQAFIQRLGISEKEACNLNVDLGVIASVDINMSGKNFGLSFCPNGVRFPSEE